MWERQAAQRHRRKMPSFSSSLLDAIYHSIDEPGSRQRNNSGVEEEIESLRRAIMVEKWVEHCGGAPAPARHLSSNSGSSTDSSAAFSSSETDSSSAASRSTPKPNLKQGNSDGAQKREGRFTRTKSRALKIYGDLKKGKEPNSPGAKIANFLNSIFSPRKTDWSPVRKSRSLKDTTTTRVSRSCLMGKNPTSSGANKSKRSVRFLDEDIQTSLPSIGSQYIRKNINSFRICENKNPRRHDNDSDVDDRSCASSDLFELENIGIRAYEEELPVYGTTSLQMNRAIATGLVI